MIHRQKITKKQAKVQANVAAAKKRRNSLRSVLLRKSQLEGQGAPAPSLQPPNVAKKKKTTKQPTRDPRSRKRMVRGEVLMTTTMRRRRTRRRRRFRRLHRTTRR